MAFRVKQWFRFRDLTEVKLDIDILNYWDTDNCITLSRFLLLRLVALVCSGPGFS